MDTIEHEQLPQIEWILEHDGKTPEGVDAFQFFLEILPLLGATDGLLRERKVLPVLYTWIIRGSVTDENARDLMRVVADQDHLFLGIGTVGEDTVYMRAFAAYLLSAFVRRHRETDLFAPQALRHLVDVSIRYLDEERDLRGYVSPETMWAHGVAHIADTVGELARCIELRPRELERMLNALGRALTTEAGVFIHEEDSRAAGAAIAILTRGLLSAAQIRAWLDRLVPAARYDGVLPNVHYGYVNARNFLRCLYHQAVALEAEKPLIEGIQSALAGLPKR